MTLTVLAFATARDRLGFSERQVDAPPAATPTQVVNELAPGLRDALPGLRVAVDEAYADWSTPLHDGQTVALIPPVSGG